MSSANKFRGHLSVLLRWAAAGLLATGASQATAASVTLCAEPYTQTLTGVLSAPNVVGTPSVPMWGYRQVLAVADCDANAGVGTASPGPLITVSAGDTTLAITLVNKLKVPTSIVLAGQALPSDGGAPVMAADVVGPACVPSPAAAASSTDPNNPQNCRVRSFTGETGVGASRTYTFANIKPGTYLYQSGTHPQVQIQMGLFGMARQDAMLTGSTDRLLYPNANAGFEVDVPVVLSEIDIEQHALIARTLGGADPTAWKAGGNSTLNYAPRFFLINGKVFDSRNPAASDLAVSAPAGSRIVLRLANAGLQSRSLMLNSGTWKLLTEDGNPYAAAREQSTVLLPANKTSDALLISTAVGDGSTNRTLAIFDRRSGTDNFDGTSMGGQVARLAITGPVWPSIGPVGAQVANEGTTFALQLLGSNITAYTLANAPTGMAISATGLISWPLVPPGTVVPTSYTVSVTGTGAALTTPASRSFDVRINHTPAIAATGPVAVAHGSVTIAAPGVLAGATDPDGDVPLSAVQTLAASSGTLTLNTNGSYSWVGPQPATGSTMPVTFSVAARDPFGLTSTARTVTLNVAGNVRPTASNLGTAANTVPTPNIPVVPGYSINLRNVAGSTSQSLVVQLAQPGSPLIIPFATLVTAIADADGLVQPSPTTFLTSTVTKVNPNNNAVVLMGGTLTTEAAAVVSVDGSTITFTPRSTGTGSLCTITPLQNPATNCGLVNSPTNSRGTYLITYTVKDDQGLPSLPASIYIFVGG